MVADFAWPKMRRGVHFRSSSLVPGTKVSDMSEFAGCGLLQLASTLEFCTIASTSTISSKRNWVSFLGRRVNHCVFLGCSDRPTPSLPCRVPSGWCVHLLLVSPFVLQCFLCYLTSRAGAGSSSFSLGWVRRLRYWLMYWFFCMRLDPARITSPACCSRLHDFPQRLDSRFAH